MKTFVSKAKRLLYFTVVLVLGIGLTYVLSGLSEKTTGPLETVLDKGTLFIDKVERNIILSKRRNSRSDKLKWFSEYVGNKEKLIHPDILLLGASDKTLDDVLVLEDALDATFPIIHIYSAWGSKMEQTFPEEQLKAIDKLGSVPMITWEPWVVDFDERKFNIAKEREDRSKNSMLSIANGTYDVYIKEWAKEAKEFGKPIYLRFAHEMNDDFRYPWGPKDNKAKEIVQAWQHVHDIFKWLKVDNIIWVWSPHLAYDLDHFYPGDAYVDVVSVGILNYGTEVYWSQWWSFNELFGDEYENINKFNKPIMIAEFGTLEQGGNRAEWYAEALDGFTEKYPEVTSIVLFHYPEDHTVTTETVSWYVKDSKEVVSVIKNKFKSILKPVR